MKLMYVIELLSKYTIKNNYGILWFFIYNADEEIFCWLLYDLYVL